MTGIGESGAERIHVVIMVRNRMTWRPTMTDDDRSLRSGPSSRVKISCFDPHVVTVRTPDPTPPFGSISYPVVELACSRPRC